MKTTELINHEIKNEWFENHRAELIETNHVSTLYWKEPGTSMYGVTYLFSGNNLIVTGDIGEAIFTFSDAIKLETFKDVNIHYLMKKLSCSSLERWKFNQNLARTQLQEWVNEHIQNAFSDDIQTERRNESYRELHGNLLSAIDDSTSTDSFEFNVWTQYMDSSLDMETEAWESITEYGRELPTHFHAYLIGLEMAISQLEQKKGK